MLLKRDRYVHWKSPLRDGKTFGINNDLGEAGLGGDVKFDSLCSHSPPLKEALCSVGRALRQASAWATNTAGRAPATKFPRALPLSKSRKMQHVRIRPGKLLLLAEQLPSPAVRSL